MTTEQAKASYARLSGRAQKTGLESLARAVLPEFGVEADRLRVLNHAFNTTFRVDAQGGEKFALRINVNSRQTPAKLSAEAAWVEALAEVEGVRVPSLVRTLDGRPYAEAPYADSEWRLTAVLYTWLPGSLIGFRAPVERYRELGEMSARIHRHAAAWAVPMGAELYPFRDPIAGYPWVMPELPEFREVYLRAEQALDRLRRNPARPIHYDLHPWNIMLCRGKVAIFDFDDACLGWPELDASVASFYYRNSLEDREREAAFLEGLGLADYGLAKEEYEALVASRQLLLANDMLTNLTSQLRRQAVSYVETARLRCAHYLDSGTFDRSVARAG